MKLKFLQGLIFLLFCTIGFSQTTKKKVTQRQINQNTRIKDGIKDGELTKREAAQLRHQQKNIAKSKREAKADGIVTKKERVQLRHQQNRANRNIVRKKNNSITR